MVFRHMQDLFLTVLTSVNIFRVGSFPKFIPDFQLYKLEVSFPEQFSDLVFFHPPSKISKLSFGFLGLLTLLHVIKTEILRCFSHLQVGCFNSSLFDFMYSPR